MLSTEISIEELHTFLQANPHHLPSSPKGPGLGLGGRMGKIASTSAMIAIEKLGIEASAIQCSVFRELRPEFVDVSRTFVDYKGIGKVPVGHTGMTIRGQFVESVVDRIQNNITAGYVADADHIPLRGDSAEEIDEFRKFVFEAKDRTFFTIDPHLCVDTLAQRVEDKYGKLINSLEKAVTTIYRIKNGTPYVIELSIDECPGVTTVGEMSYLLSEINKRNISIFSIAPAIGFDKKDCDSTELRKSLKKLLPELNKVAMGNGLNIGNSFRRWQNRQHSAYHRGDNKWEYLV